MERPRPIPLNQSGVTALEMLISVLMMGMVISVTSGMFVASKGHIRTKSDEVETTQAARSALDVLVRDLRLGGACLPVTGEFISLAGSEAGDQDEITTRTGLTRPDLSCIRSASTVMTQPGDPAIVIESTEGFEDGMHAYIRHPNGSGEFFDISTVVSSTSLGKAGALSQSYPPTSGVYAIDERRFFLTPVTHPGGTVRSHLMMQIGTGVPMSFAVGIERLNVEYQLGSNCNPTCNVVDLPQTIPEWQQVEQVHIGITARSNAPDAAGNYMERSVEVAVKPRNILPR